VLVPAGGAEAETRAPSAAVSAERGPESGALESSRIEREISRVLRTSLGARRTGPWEVSWDGGAVVSRWTLPRAQTSTSASTSMAVSAASSYAGCPDGTYVHWFCFYEHASYGGRMLQFRDCPSTQSLAAYGFANAATSWVNNRSGATVTVYDGSSSGTVLWREYGRSHSSNVGSWANDRADTFTCST
jgi:hypothetical protein